jgi:hypothetical protein
MLSRRQLLGVSPLLLILCGCDKPAVLSAPPVPSRQTQLLLDAVTAEQNLVWLYDKASATYPQLNGVLMTLRAEHAAHLAQLRATVVEPPGKHVPTTVQHQPAIGKTQRDALSQLRGVEQGAVTTLMGRLNGASPSLAQLYASIAASETTHVGVLNALTARISAK